MEESQKKRNRAEKEALRLLKKLRKNADELESQEKEMQPRPVYGPLRPPSLTMASTSPPKKTVIGPELPDFLKDVLPTEDDLEEEVVEGGMVGPMLPDDWGQKAAGNQGQRRNDDEVERILKLIQEDGGFLDPYSILGISIEDANDAAVKKAYWKCSLLVHPDKNAHPQAQKAFQALNRAWKEVQSADHRLTIEKKREDATIRQQAEREARKAQRQQEWMDVMNPGSRPHPGHGKREAWMTELPKLRRKPAIAKQINQTTFSRKAYADISKGASDWNHTPNTTNTETFSVCSSNGLSQKSSQGSQSAVRHKRPSLMEQHQVCMDQKSRTSKSAASNKSRKESW